MNEEEINIDEQLTILETTKAQLKQSIINKGQSISEEDSFRSYVGKVDNIVVLSSQTKSVTPTTQQQIIEPDAPTYNGLSQVAVAGVTSAIDSNIQASNIKNGVSILGVNGSVVELNGETKTVTPTTSQQTIVPTGTGKNALTEVTVNAVTSAIDQNIVASNIKNGVTILGVQGTYNPYQIREYASVTAMNDDIANIQEGEVVKVVENNVTTFYVKETTMKKLVKEEDTLSPEEAQEVETQVGDLLGEEE